MRIAYTSRADGDFLLRGVMRDYAQVAEEVCWLTRFDICALLSIMAAASWIDVKALFGFEGLAGALAAGGVAAAGIFAYMLLKIAMVAVRMLARVWPGPRAAAVEIQPGICVTCKDGHERSLNWADMVSAKKYDDMYILTFRAGPAQERSVMVARAKLTPGEEAALENALVLDN